LDCSITCRYQELINIGKHCTLRENITQRIHVSSLSVLHKEKIFTVPLNSRSLQLSIQLTSPLVAINGSSLVEDTSKILIYGTEDPV